MDGHFSNSQQKHVFLRFVRMPLLILFLISSIIQAIGAAPIFLKASTSPDGKHILTIEPFQNDSDGSCGILQIRNADNKKILSSFPFWQFGSVVTEDSAAVLWKPDGQAFALTVGSGRHWTNSDIFACGGNKWIKLGVPEFKTKYTKENGWIRRFRGGFVLVSWLPHDVLKMRYDNDSYRYDKNGDMEVSQASWIYLKLLWNTQGPFLDVRSIDEKSVMAPDPD